MRRWGSTVYHCLFRNDIDQTLKTETQGDGWARKKLDDILSLAAKQVPFYKPYKQVPFSLWPTVDENMVHENRDQFQIRSQDSIKALSSDLSVLSRPELSLCRQLKKNKKIIYFDHIVGYYCQHQKLCFPKELYWIEKAWVDEEHLRFAPVVTTLTRRKSLLIRFRLNQIFISEDSPCECQTHAFTVANTISTADEVLYLPHLFEKRSLPVFRDELEQFFKQFYSIQVIKIVQQSLSKWRIHIAKNSIDLSEYESDLSDKFETFLMVKQVKCPEIRLIEDETQFESDASFSVVKQYS